MDPRFYAVALDAGGGVALLGVLVRAGRWFVVRVGPEARASSPAKRLGAALRGVPGAVFSRRFPALMATFFLDVLLQRRLLRRDPLRWLAHLLVYLGFTLLLVFHALETLVTAKLFEGYASTRSPFVLLRDLFGLLVVVGLALSFLRRRIGRGRIPAPARRDPLFSWLIVSILVSGFALKGAKISSSPIFFEMADDYLGMDDPEDLAALMAIWAADYGVVFSDFEAPTDPDVVEEGRTLHTEGCAVCHARPTAAFVSHAFAGAMRPAAATLAEKRADRTLLHVHVLLCLLTLAYLPFGRLFHVVADPVQLLARRAADERPPMPANRATGRALALDACVRCGLCDIECSVEPIRRALDNDHLRPSQKVLNVRRAARGARDPVVRRAAIAEGAHACTSCGRCTTHCPVGLDLQDLWAAQRADLVALGHPAAAVAIRARPAVEWADAAATGELPAHRTTHLTEDRSTFSACVQCQTCTNVCPVVALGTDAGNAVELTPQKIMNLLRLGLRDLAIGSRMVWDCATCYLCQEHCPEGIRVTEVLYELRNLGYARLGAARREQRGSEEG